MNEAVSIVAAYLLGSVPFALLLTRRRGIDLRRVGSGNVGAANVLRTSGTRAAVLVMCLDVTKGALAVLVAQRIAGGGATPVAAGFASILGHIYPVWLSFHGGKGVATAAGVFAIVAPVALTVAAVVFLGAVWITRYVSIGSMAATICLVIIVAIDDVRSAVTLGAISSAAVILHRHRSNFARIMAGTERRVGQRVFENAAG